MKKKVNLIPLSRTEMKKITAGESFCSVGKFVSACYCGGVDGYGPFCIPADGNTPAHACNDWCLGNYGLTGVANGNTCVTSCNF